MVLIRKALYLTLFYLTLIRSQFHLEITDYTRDSVGWEHDCFYLLVDTGYFNEPLQIIPYCLSEWPTKWDIQENSAVQKYTFATLSNLSITSEQLYDWSAPIDLIEHYQFYLNHKNTSYLSERVVYNCTLPRFGPQCQYSFEGFESSDFSLKDIIERYYSVEYAPTTLTCYMHLKCDRGLPEMCLDWTEICDGQVDCLNDAVDEKYCGQLELNQCDANEYRCKTGQCIPDIFRQDSFETAYNCLDKVDEYSIYSKTNGKRTMQPIFSNEDIRCERIDRLTILLTSSCEPKRQSIIRDLMVTSKPEFVSDQCWYAYQCYFAIIHQYHRICNILCPNTETCFDIINSTICPDMLFIPNTPLFFGHVYFVYTKQTARNLSLGSPLRRINRPTYICYDDRLCQGFISNKTKIVLNNLTCRSPLDFPVAVNLFAQDWLTRFVLPAFKFFSKCNGIVDICNGSSVYRCANTSKCISYQQIGDGHVDCRQDDDEKQIVIDEICSKDRLNIFYYCTSTNKCIHRKKLYDRECDCGEDENGLCEDKDLILHTIRKRIAFPMTCDGFPDLLPILIDGKNETDETGCDLWACNNTYTRCDNNWNCANGADEVNCQPSLLCMPEHMCIHLEYARDLCFPVKNGSVDILNCLDLDDQKQVCRSNAYLVKFDEDLCVDPPLEECIYLQQAYASEIECNTFYLPNMCRRTSDLTIFHTEYGRFCSPTDYNFSTFAYEQNIQQTRILPIHFALDVVEQPVIDNTLKMEPLKAVQYNQRCHRGLPLIVWIDREKNLTNTTCLCPPSFYGNICQYQNQRVSLSLKFQVYSDSQQTLFSILIFLIDSSEQRTVHSYQQYTFLHARDCEIKFNNYLLYSNQTNDNSKNYSIHIDIYDKNLLNYRGSILIPIQFPFLPVNRIATLLTIPRVNEELIDCFDEYCVHGQCVKYANDTKQTTFCQCHPGWSGQHCSIQYNCTCSNGSICTGITATNRSICLCPIDKFGSRCLLDNSVCKSNPCLNNGQCIPLDQHRIVNQSFYCRCRKGFTGSKCEHPTTKIILSYDKNIVLPQTMTLRIPFIKKTTIVYWAHSFHVAFLELTNKIFHLITVQKTYDASAEIFYTINTTNRCKRFNELVETSIAESHLIRRIKYYHFVCRQHAHLLCFSDIDFFCLCTDFDHQRLANCFEFDQRKQYDCFGRSNCENGAQCVQDRSTCPKTSMCICPSCYYGTRCQFSSDGFGLTLDGILGYHIQPHISIYRQSLIVNISLAFTSIITIAGMINGILMIVTFKSKKLRQNGCGMYLLYTSIGNIVTIVFFALKFFILFIAQRTYLTNQLFLRCQCVSIDFLLRSSIQITQWLQACVAIERVIVALEGVKFNQAKSKQIATYVTPFVVIFGTLTTLHDPFHRRLIDEDDNDEERKRIWCIVVYPPTVKFLNSFLNIFHSFVPFIINILTTIIIIVKTAQRRVDLAPDQQYFRLVIAQIRAHRHLFTSSVILVVLALPHLIISFVSGCMKSVNDSELLLTGYFISFIPSILTSVIFIVPSKAYKEEFWQSMKQYRTRLQALLF
ncbi:unnamed protein product [Adineta ricciae]|uniref:Uncharacterized protein n=1 Tax=Adineta ricciae TaxID=249248 RepID=A0A815AU51_ADIRI|nr:unnamed protein product [Adineta ricciae]CAF1364429.1 unnamed protein product [Adineta ricciae]